MKNRRNRLFKSLQTSWTSYQKKKMDRNGMLQGLMNPIMSVGVIPGKVQLDWVWIKEAMANADDPATAALCFPGGAKDINHDAMPGMLSFGLKCVRNAEVMEGEPNELGICSLAGTNTDMYSSARAIEDQFYFQGFVATPCRVSGHHMDNNTNDPDHGYATVRAGTCNAINNGPFTFYPGSYMATRLPPNPKTTYKLMDGDSKFENRINERARAGTSNTRFAHELVPFDYMDFSTQLAGAYASMRESQSSAYTAGISDMTLSDFFKTDFLMEVPSFSTEAEEAAGHKYGKIGECLAGIETLAQLGYISINDGDPKVLTSDEKVKASLAVAKLSGDIGLWKKSTNPIQENLAFLKMIANMHFMELFETTEVEAAKTSFRAAFKEKPGEVGAKHLFSNDVTENYKKLRVHLSKFSEGHLVGNWFSKTSKIVGRSLNAAAPGDTIHVLAGHFTL